MWLDYSELLSISQRSCSPRGVRANDWQNSGTTLINIINKMRNVHALHNSSDEFGVFIASRFLIRIL